VTASPDRLPAAPADLLDDEGAPRFGAYRGEVPRVTFAGLRGPYARSLLYRAAHAKRWHHVGVAGPRLHLACAILDLGWATGAFVTLFDRARRRLIADRSGFGAPLLGAAVSDRPGEGALSWFYGPRLALVLERPVGAEAWRVHVRGAGGLRVDLALPLAGAPPTLAAVAAVDGGVANCTHKTVGLPVHGRIELGGEALPVDGAFAALDHTAGLLPHHTRWRWACIAGPAIGLNLVDGFNGPVENCLWSGGRQIPLAAGAIGVGGDGEPWTARSAEGRVDLRFVLEGEHRVDRDLRLAATHYRQAFGVFSGQVDGRAVDGLPGVVEDQDSVW
jgi:hypothetical protein